MSLTWQSVVAVAKRRQRASRAAMRVLIADSQTVPIVWTDKHSLTVTFRDIGNMKADWEISITRKKSAYLFCI